MVCSPPVAATVGSKIESFHASPSLSCRAGSFTAFFAAGTARTQSSLFVPLWDLIHSFLICPLLLRIAAQCSLHAWGEQSSTRKHNRSYHPAHKVEEGALAS